VIATPIKPFPNYKWQWATLTCTEGLDYPPVFLGVLKALRKYQGRPPTNPDFINELSIVQAGTSTRVNLSRTGDRNLIRNSGQYWKALDLLEDTRGNIRLTQFGEKVADGAITPMEFAMAVIKTLQLPNIRVEQNPAPWVAAGLEIKPLELIIKILAELERLHGRNTAFITPLELRKITVPLAGAKESLATHIEAIISYRNGTLNISGWPDCAPGSNDRRMVREFLLFLSYYGICDQTPGGGHDDEKYTLKSLDMETAIELANVNLGTTNTTQAAQNSVVRELTGGAERRRVYAEILARPQQARFRRAVLNAYGNRCLITGTSLPDVLEAAHIVPVADRGLDRIANGLCLRSDIHVLFDSGHLRIDNVGGLHLTPSAAATYTSLPRRVTLPAFVDMRNIDWRWQYY
jgi:hypothetical protein